MAQACVAYPVARHTSTPGIAFEKPILVREDLCRTSNEARAAEHMSAFNDAEGKDAGTAASTDASAADATFNMGPGTFVVPMRMHAESRARLVASMREAGFVTGLVLLSGGEQQTQYDTDTDVVFRQESYFNWLFGVKEPGWHGTVDLASGRATLFMPLLPATWEVWCGAVLPAEHYRDLYDVDAVETTTREGEAEGGALEAHCRGGGSSGGDGQQPLYLLRGLNTDSNKITVTVSNLAFPWLRQEGESTASCEARGGLANVDTVSLHPIAAECRVIKTPEELRLMRHVSAVTSMAHVDVMRAIKPGMLEYQLESLFQVRRREGRE